MEKICDVLQHDSSRIEDPDRKEFCLIMTSDMGLNPDSGIKVIPVNAADQEKYALYKQKYEALMSNIKKDLGVK